MQELLIESDLDVAAAMAARDDLVARINAVDAAGIRLDLTGPAPTVPAQQLLLATRAMLTERDLSHEVGDHARHLLSQAGRTA